ncbi:MAG: hypothetical protein KME46_15480 [Brasilonema angustatum HA4187-MV1]|jgi:hypothetical protein|nr:hypothetical protein [Brasilonema angustatum HA4187-MV1]
MTTTASVGDKVVCQFGVAESRYELCVKRSSAVGNRHAKAYAPLEELFIDGVLKNDWKDLIVEIESDGRERINRVNYEISVLQALRDRLRSKEIWVVGAKRYCNPEEDLPQDFDIHREIYYQAIGQPLEAVKFITTLQQEMTDALTMLDKGMPKNTRVKIQEKNNG